MAVVFSARDPNGVLILCHDHCWKPHASRHPEIVGREEWAQKTISEPLLINQSNKHAKRRRFYRQYDFGKPIGRWYMRVVVEYQQKRRGLRIGIVVSVHGAVGPQKGEVPLWP